MSLHFSLTKVKKVLNVHEANITWTTTKNDLCVVIWLNSYILTLYSVCACLIVLTGKKPYLVFISLIQFSR